MQLEPIARSLAETDLYKLSMGQVIHHKFPLYKTTWTFECRNKGKLFTPEMVEEIKEQIKYYCTLRFTKAELEYIRSIEWITDDFVDYLSYWHPKYEDFTFSTEAECGLFLEAKGTWLSTSMYEIASLYIISEVYSRMGHDYNFILKVFEECLERKAKMLEPPSAKYFLKVFSEFGLRRRISAEAQELAVKRFMKLKDNHSITTFVGTSNVYLAMKLGCKPVGTMAHEYIMCVGQGNPMYDPAYSNRLALKAWVEEYGTLNGIALTDTITTDCFLKDFTKPFATLFSGVRHDSGDPFEWGEKMVADYKSLGIDPKTKTLLFSDSLDFEKAYQIYWHFKDLADVAFGIGTDLSGISAEVSKITGVEAPNIVMKVTECNGRPVAKLSDTPGKCMCKNPDHIDFLRRCINYRMQYG